MIKRGLILFGYVAVAALAVLLVMSPAAFVSLMPGWLGTDDSESITAGLVAALCIVLAGLLAVNSRPIQPLRALTIGCLVMGAVVLGLYATKLATTTPIPENTCVAYSGGSHTCPGG